MVDVMKNNTPLTAANMHFGNMEGLLKIAEELNVVTVGKTQNNPYVNKEIIKNRKCFNITLLQRSPSVGRELVKYAEELNVVTVGKTQNNPYVNKEIIKNRKCFNITLLQRSPSVGRELVKYAKQGRNIAILTDQKGSGTEVTFFGEPTTSPTGITSIACKFDRPLFLVYCVYQKDFSTRAFIKEIKKCEDETLPFKDRVQITTQNMIHEMEKVILAHPDQWMWMHDRWTFYRQYKKGTLRKDLADFAKTLK